MIPESEINQRAGEIADAVTNILKQDGIIKAAVVVTKKPDIDNPLAIRTPLNDGFGEDTIQFHKSQTSLLQIARLQAKYANRAGGRSSADQERKLNLTNRGVSSYGLDLPLDMEAGFAHDKKAGLTVIASITMGNGNYSSYASHVSEIAIDLVEARKTVKPLEASKLVYAATNELLRLGLPKDRTGFCLLAHPKFFHDPALGVERDALVICSQATGSVSQPESSYKIVSAKAGTVAITSYPSGPDTHGFKGVSQIQGGIPISTHFGEAVLAAGGLLEGKDDVAAIQNTIDFLGEKMGIALLSKLTRR